MLSTKDHVKDQIDFMDDRDEKEWMESVYDGRSFPFTYKGIANKDPNAGHDIEQFWRDWFVAAKFSIHAINFRSKITPEGTFCYNFRL